MGSLLDMRTRIKLLTAFISMAVIVAVLGIISSFGSGSLNGYIQNLYDDRFVPAVQLGNIATLISKLRIGALNIIIEQDPAKRKAIFETADNYKKQIDQIVKKYGSRKLNPEDRKIFEEFERNWKAFDESRLKTYNLALEGNVVDAMENALNDVSIKFKEADAKLVALINLQDEIGKDLYKRSESDYLLMKAIAIVATVIASIVAILLGLILSKRIANPLLEGVNFAKGIAKGDLTQRLDSSIVNRGDEIGQLCTHLNEMSGNLSGIVNSIKSSSDSISEAVTAINTERLVKGSTTQTEAVENISIAVTKANQSIAVVAEAADSLSNSAEESSSSIYELTASIEEVAESANHLAKIVETMSSSIEETVAAINQTSEHLDSVSASASETAATVNEFRMSLKNIEKNVNDTAALSEKVTKDASTLGTNAIEKTIDGMKLIIESVNATMVMLDRLRERSAQIGNIITVIENVTEQTNLLSLNAAIIAAQAGEHGKGFAVVADAIKELADQTASSTNEISSMIAAVQSEIRTLTASIQEVSDKAISGMALANKAGGVLNGIAESSNISSSMALEIQKATKEQAIGVSQINENIERITERIHQIAQATKERKTNSNYIITAVEDLRDISRRVELATVEQAKGSGQITNTVELVNQKVKSIVDRTNEQKTGSNQIVKAMEQIRAITSQNLVIASEVNRAIGTLSQQTERLRREVGNFTV